MTLAFTTSTFLVVMVCFYAKMIFFLPHTFFIHNGLYVCLVLDYAKATPKWF